MADNVAITAGSGVTIATDDVGGVQYQKVKLVDSTADSSTATGVAANPLQVSLANTGANSNKILTTPDLPTGASTAAKQDTGNTSLASIDSKLPALGQALAAASVPVILPAATITTLTPPAAITGFATAAKQDTAQTALDAIKTATEVLDNAIAGTEMQVDVVAALPAGNNNIGDVDVASIAAGDNNIGNVDIVTVPADPFGANADASSATGSISAKLRATATALEIMDDWDNGASDGASVSGDVAHDTADAGEPVKVGGKAVSAEPAAVTANDRVNAQFDLTGKQVVLPYAIPELLVSGANASAITDTTSTEIIAAPGAGVKLYITSITVTNADADTGTLVKITDGSGGTLKYQGHAAAAGGGWSIALPSPLVLTANTALHAVCGTTGATVYVAAAGFKGR